MQPAVLSDDYDELVTPVVRIGDDGRVTGCNAAFARWLGVSRKRLLEQPVTSLEVDGDTLRQALKAGGDEDSAPRRLRRIALAFHDGEPSFADAWLGRDARGLLLEIHPVD